MEIFMKEDDKKTSCGTENCDSVESINEKNQKQPAQPSNNKEEDSYEAQTLMDGVGSSLDEEERLNCDTKEKPKTK
jgi:hypothetical protein